MANFEIAMQAGTVSAALVSSTSVQGQARSFGLALFDSEKRVFSICEFKDDSQLSKCEALLLQAQPATCCVLLGGDEMRKLRQVGESVQVELQEYKSQSVDLEQDLLRLLRDTEAGLSRHLETLRLKQGSRALACLIGHRELLSDTSLFGSCTLTKYPVDSIMHLDKAAFSALNLLPGPAESVRAHTSIFGFLNRCRSLLGIRRLRQWLTQPLTRPEELCARHDIVEALIGAESLLRSLEDHFRRVPDLEVVSARFHRLACNSKASHASLEDLVNLYQCICSTGAMTNELASYSGIHKDRVAKAVTEPLVACVADFQGLRALVEQTIDLSEADKRNFCVSMNFDESLKKLASKRDIIRDRMETVRSSVDTELNLQKARGEKAVSLFEGPEGTCLRVVKKQQQAVQNHKGKTKIKTLAIKKQEFVFTTPELEKLNEEYKASIKAYEDQSNALAKKALSVAATYRPVIARLAEHLGSLDVLAAFARTALSAPCSFVRAKVDAEGHRFEIEGAVHVLVAANSQASYVANNLTMEQQESRLHLITGPNMGGKSTYIRSVALIALLNQIGSFVPCQSATLPLFDAIMCRVGASDMQLRGISTFMAEMLEASCILGTATSRTLVIVDELGRGTSTSDGFGIAWAIARHLVEEIKCFTLFATHFHELARLQDVSAAVRNRHATAAVDAASGRLTFLYALADGAAEKSYGAHVAELAGFPQRVVQAAKERAERFESEAACQLPAEKRRRLDDSDAMKRILAADNEEDFVRLAMENLPMLKEAIA